MKNLSLLILSFFFIYNVHGQKVIKITHKCKRIITEGRETWTKWEKYEITAMWKENSWVRDMKDGEINGTKMSYTLNGKKKTETIEGGEKTTFYATDELASFIGEDGEVYFVIKPNGNNSFYVDINGQLHGYAFKFITPVSTTNAKTNNTSNSINYSVNIQHTIHQCHFCKKRYEMKIPSRIVEVSNSEGKSALIEAAYFYSNQVDNTNMINSKCLALSNESDKHEFLEIKKWNTIQQKKEHNESYDEVMKSYESLGAIEKSIFVNCMKATTAALAAGKIGGID